MDSRNPAEPSGPAQDSLAGQYKCFSTDSLKALTGHVCSLLDQCQVPVDKGLLRQTLTAIQPNMEPAAVGRCMKDLLERESKANPASEEALAEKAAALFAGAMSEAYCLHVGRYLEAVNWNKPLNQAVEAEARSFGQTVLRRLLPLARVAATGCVAPRVVQPPAHPLLDAFGRSLLSPLERRYPILDQEDSPRRGAPGFPRAFCAPVLAEIKFRLIGDDKYDATNAKFIHSIRNHCHVEGQLDRAKMQEYFDHPTVRQYVVAYSLHLSMLTTSWALFVFDNRDSAPLSSATHRILRFYIPGRMDSLGE